MGHGKGKRENIRAADDAWLKKEKKHQKMNGQRLIRSARVKVSNGVCYTLRTFDWFLLKAKTGTGISRHAKASKFLLSFKGQVKIRRVAAIIQRAFEDETMERLTN